MVMPGISVAVVFVRSITFLGQRDCVHLCRDAPHALRRTQTKVGLCNVKVVRGRPQGRRCEKNRISSSISKILKSSWLRGGQILKLVLKPSKEPEAQNPQKTAVLRILGARGRLQYGLGGQLDTTFGDASLAHGG